MATFSKLKTVNVPCKAYVHPWCDSCSLASIDLLPSCAMESLRIYIIAYSVALLMRGKTPSQTEIKRTIFGILQSSLFLTLHGVGFPAFLCFVRYILGHFNIFTVGYIPKFLLSIITILVERPSRRALLSLYVTNVASETLFRMAVSRKLITPLCYGEVLVFAVSVSYLLYLYKGPGLPKDPVYSLLRFLVGPFEEHDYLKIDEFPLLRRKHEISSNENPLIKLVLKVQNKWNEIIYKIKTFSSSSSCPHSYSCLHYILSGCLRTFSIGLGLQLALRVVMGLKRMITNPSFIKKSLLRSDNLRIAVCFGSFTALFRGISCLLRRYFGSDKELSAVPAGFIAGLAFYFYRNNTIALYFMWKAFQLFYSFGVKKGIVPDIPYASVFFYALSTGLLFHVAMVEPHNLRPSYWRFLQAMSGNRISLMDRVPIDKFGLETCESLASVLAKENRGPIERLYKVV